MESKYENLEKLNDLYKQGVVSEDEYNREKSSILENSATCGLQAGSNKHTTYSSLMHLTHFGDYILPGTSLIAPIAMWAAKKEASEFVDVNGKILFNWKLSLILYSLVFTTIFLIGGGISIFTTAFYDNPANLFGLLGTASITLVPLAIIGILNFIFTIVGAIKASNGEVWNYPLSIRFFKTQPSTSNSEL